METHLPHTAANDDLGDGFFGTPSRRHWNVSDQVPGNALVCRSIAGCDIAGTPKPTESHAVVERGYAFIQVRSNSNSAVLAVGYA